jgi:hypothetical protein
MLRPDALCCVPLRSLMCRLIRVSAAGGISVGSAVPYVSCRCGRSCPVTGVCHGNGVRRQTIHLFTKLTK